MAVVAVVAEHPHLVGADLVRPLVFPADARRARVLVPPAIAVGRARPLAPPLVEQGAIGDVPQKLDVELGAVRVGRIRPHVAPGRDLAVDHRPPGHDLERLAGQRDDAFDEELLFVLGEAMQDDLAAGDRRAALHGDAIARQQRGHHRSAGRLHDLGRGAGVARHHEERAERRDDVHPFGQTRLFLRCHAGERESEEGNQNSH